MSTVYSVLLDKAKIILQGRVGTSLNHEQFRGCWYPDFEVALLEWFRKKRSTFPEICISITMLSQNFAVKNTIIIRCYVLRKCEVQMHMDAYPCNKKGFHITRNDRMKETLGILAV